MAATSSEHTEHETALTRKLGPLPVWAWAAVGIGLALLFSNRKKSSSSSSAQAGSPFGYSLASQQQASGLASSYGSAYPIGYSDYSSSADLAGVLSQLSGQISHLGAGNSGTTGTPAPSPGNTMTGPANQTYSGEPVYGSGFGNPSGISGSDPISTAGGSYSYLGSMAQVQGIQAAGGTVYFQEAPGTFAAVPSGLKGLAAGTPLYAKAA